jgi:hypothetical protein
MTRFLLLLLFASASELPAQTPAADPRDVGTVEGMVRAYYEVINGPPGASRQWRRDSTLYMPAATFVAMDERNGLPHPTVMTPEEYRRAVDQEFVAHGFFEQEVGASIERFGHLAQVRSVYQTRRTADGPVTGRGVNYLMLYWDGIRWWIAGAMWDDERDGNPIPAGWVTHLPTAP